MACERGSVRKKTVTVLCPLLRAGKARTEARVVDRLDRLRRHGARAAAPRADDARRSWRAERDLSATISLALLEECNPDGSGIVAAYRERRDGVDGAQRALDPLDAG
eukprot:COSAG02_NODE_29083_length_576_cov_1.052411_2_plen_106_part_01